MVGDIQGYCIIRTGSTTGKGTHLPLSEYEGKPLRVLEFATDGGVLVIYRQGKAHRLCMFDKVDVKCSFKCKEFGGLYLCPPEMDYLQQIEYAARCMGRKGGYNHVVRSLVIGASLHKNQFNDSVLWAKK